DIAPTLRRRGSERQPEDRSAPTKRRGGVTARDIAPTLRRRGVGRRPKSGGGLRTDGGGGMVETEAHGGDELGFGSHSECRARRGHGAKATKRRARPGEDARKLRASLQRGELASGLWRGASPHRVRKVPTPPALARGFR